MTAKKKEKTCLLCAGYFRWIGEKAFAPYGHNALPLNLKNKFSRK